MTAAHDNADFASATMMRLIAAGLARQGISVPMRAPQSWRVPLIQKRSLLEEILAEHGARTILAIADAAPDLPAEPVTLALTRARDADDLFDRWRRLERFSHSRHTVAVQPAGAGSYRLEHRAKRGSEGPTHAESLLVYGLLTILLEMVSGSKVTLAGQDGEVWRADGTWHDNAARSHSGAVVLKAAHQEVAPPHPERFERTDPLEYIRARLASDPVRRWAISELAAEAGMSVRTLQRRLSDNALSFSHLLAETRLKVAATHLCTAHGPGLAEVGFLSGYYDQAHFTRAFSNAVGTTPSAYRADFQA